MDDKILRVIRKSLALASNNPNANEAQTALLKAQELMAKHNITMGEVEVNQTPKEKVIAKDGATDYKRVVWWEKTLASILSENFRCNYYRTLLNNKSKIMFYGLKEDVELVKEAYVFALNQIKFLADHYIKSNGIKGRTKINAVKNDYISGFLKGLKDMFAEQVQKNNWGLVLVKDALVVQGYKKLSKGFKSSKSSSYSVAENSEARGQGYNDGRSFNSNRNSLTC